LRGYSAETDEQGSGYRHDDHQRDEKNKMSHRLFLPGRAKQHVVGRQKIAHHILSVRKMGWSFYASRALPASAALE
jgi:hypothetical protein